LFGFAIPATQMLSGAAIPIAVITPPKYVEKSSARRLPD
jgi:hypothetical protein